MSESPSARIGSAARALVAGCFVGGVLALVGQRVRLAGVAYLAGYTVLSAAAVARGRRRRGVGFSLSGVGCASLAMGAAAGYRTDTGLALVVAGVVLLVIGTGTVVGGLSEGESP